jgi:CRISPR-associated RAMP protein, csm3 family
MKIYELKGQIKLLSGLHIGGGDDTMKIGGIDNQVIKQINSKEPYIPGSSLKGKMRSLLEWDLRVVNISDGQNKGKPFSAKFLGLVPDIERKNVENLLKIFGDSDTQANKFGITRISFSDCPLTEDVRNKTKNGALKLTESKYENVIDRIKGTASNPRQTERVPAGIEFKYDIKLKVLDDDDKSEFFALVERGMTLLERDYLGGSGSRGYGRIEFSNKKNWNEL